MSSAKENKTEGDTAANSGPRKEEVSNTTGQAPDDLDDLDDLLDDFADDLLSKPPGSTVAGSNVEDSTKGTNEAKETGSGKNDDPLGNIEDLIKDLDIKDPDTKKQFEQLVKQFESEHREDADKIQLNPDFESVMKDTLNRVKKSGKDIDEEVKNEKTSSNPEDMLSSLLSGMGGANGDMDMSKLLVDMLEQLSSKEVLYEPIKDLNTKFPDYLKEKKGSISEEEYNNYTQQYEVTEEIVAVFESPTYNDSDSTQRENVNSLLEKLQGFGQPPADLVGDAGDFPGLGALGGESGNLDFNDKDIPKEFEKELEDGCKQQ